MIAYPLLGYTTPDVQTFSNFSIHSVFENTFDAREAGKSKIFIGTSVLVTEETNNKIFFHLKAALTLIEGSEVEIQIGFKPNTLSEAKAEIRSIECNDPRHSNISIVDLDNSPARQKLLKCILDRAFVSDQSEQDQFNNLLHRYALALHKGDSNFIDIKYYSLWSGLEAFARQRLSDNQKGGARPVCNLLKSIGVNFRERDDTQPSLCAEVYNSLRHGLYHNGELEGLYKGKRYKLIDYIQTLQRLVCWVICHESGYEDKHIDYRSWVDRELVPPV